jgi:hypothetical protein
MLSGESMLGINLLDELYKINAQNKWWTDIAKFYFSSITTIIKLLSDDITITLLHKIISTPNQDSEQIRKGMLKLTKKQYYLRLSQLMRTHIIARNHGKYTATGFGLVINEALKLLIVAAKERYKLQLIDNFPKDEIPQSEYEKLISQLIENNDLKQIITSDTHS